MASRSPGVYIGETQLTPYGRGVSGTTVGIVGKASKGPAGLTLLRSQKELTDIFGTSMLSDCTVFAAHTLLATCDRLYFGRVVSSTAAKTEGSITETENAILSVEAKEFGTALNGATIEITRVANEAFNKKSTFVITSAQSKILETINFTGDFYQNVKSSLVTFTKSDNYDEGSFIEAGTEEVVATFTLGSTGTDANTGITDSEYKGTLELFENQDVYQIDILLAPGIFNQDGEFVDEVNNSMISVCEARKKDCVALLEIPQTELTIAAANSFTNKELGDASYDTDIGLFYWPPVRTTDPHHASGIIVPASIYVARQMIYTDNTAAFWHAPAGLKRGMITGITGLTVNTSQAERDALNSGGNIINPITIYRGQGPVIFGNSTSLRDKSMPTASVNVRRMLSRVMRDIQMLSARLLFDNATSELWDQWKLLVAPYLDNIVNQNGIYSYQLVMDKTNNTDDDLNNARVNGRVYITPVKASEVIDLGFVITPAGVEIN